MGYDRGDSFPFDFELNGILFGLKSKGKLSLRSYPIQCEWKWKYSFLSVNYAHSYDKRHRKNTIVYILHFSTLTQHSIVHTGPKLWM